MLEDKSSIFFLIRLSEKIVTAPHNIMPCAYIEALIYAADWPAPGAPAPGQFTY